MHSRQLPRQCIARSGPHRSEQTIQLRFTRASLSLLPAALSPPAAAAPPAVAAGAASKSSTAPTPADPATACLRLAAAAFFFASK